MADPRYPYSSPVNSDEQRAAQMSTGYVNAPTYVPVVPESKAVASRRGVVAACILLFAKLVLLVDKFIPWSYELSALYASRTQGTSFWFWSPTRGGWPRSFRPTERGAGRVEVAAAVVRRSPGGRQYG